MPRIFVASSSLPDVKVNPAPSWPHRTGIEHAPLDVAQSPYQSPMERGMLPGTNTAASHRRTPFGVIPSAMARSPETSRANPEDARKKTIHDPGTKRRDGMPARPPRPDEPAESRVESHRAGDRCGVYERRGQDSVVTIPTSA